MNKTKIPYLTHSWNPLAMRCTPCSPGCANCWHLAMAERMAANPTLSTERRGAYCQPDDGGTGPLLLEDELIAPLRLKKSARIGVQFMGDLFHDNVTDEMRDQVWAVMGCCEDPDMRQHTWVILTKRPHVAAGYVASRRTRGMIFGLPNLWLGVTVCDWVEADSKTRILLQIPAAVRWLSIEPMLGPTNLRLPPGPNYPLPHVNWVVVGCESGSRRRPCKIEWVRSVVEQCKVAGVACFVKQLDLGGKCVADPAQFPKDLRIREYPK